MSPADVAHEVSATTTRLDGGLRVVTVELPHLHTATLVLYVKIGSRLEVPADNGLSHFVEHMLFRGTDRYPTSFDLNLAFESLGGTLYAETGRDYSLYQVTLVPELIEHGLELYGELFGRPRFADLELERKLVLEEMTEDYDERGVEINAPDLARGVLFGDHPLGQRIIGSRANVERFDLADVRRHFERFYVAANAILAVAGPIRHDAVVAAAARHLAGIRGGEEAAPEPAHTTQTAPRVKHVHDAGAQSELELLWRGVAENDPDYVPAVALVRTLDDGMSTRLHYQLCDQLGLAYSIQAGVEPLHDVSLIEVSGATANAKVPELVRRVLELFVRYRDEEVGVAELEKAKRRYRYDLLASIDDANAMAGWFAGTALYYPPSGLAARIEAMDAVTPADVQRAARRILAPENLTLVVVGALSRARVSEIKSMVAGFPAA
jgi:predicted Zn-dependent peptidase